jgi:seryl-tRNA synthetase
MTNLETRTAVDQRSAQRAAALDEIAAKAAAERSQLKEQRMMLVDRALSDIETVAKRYTPRCKDDSESKSIETYTHISKDSLESLRKMIRDEEDIHSIIEVEESAQLSADFDPSTTASPRAREAFLVYRKRIFAKFFSDLCRSEENFS